MSYFISIKVHKLNPSRLSIQESFCSFVLVLQTTCCCCQWCCCCCCCGLVHLLFTCRIRIQIYRCNWIVNAWHCKCSSAIHVNRNDWDEISGPCYTRTHTHIRTRTRTHTQSATLTVLTVAIEHARLFSSSIFNGSPMERCTIEIKVSLSLSANAIDPVWHYPMPSPRLASHRLIFTIWYHIRVYCLLICRFRDRDFIHIVELRT